MVLGSFAGLALLFAVAAIFLAVALMYVRARDFDEAHTTVPEWTRAVVDGADCDPATRIELVERLTLIAEPWCLDTLREATKEERHPQVRKALDEAWRTLR